MGKRMVAINFWLGDSLTEPNSLVDLSSHLRPDLAVPDLAAPKKLNELTKLCCIAEKGNNPRKKYIRKPRSFVLTSWFYFLNKLKQSIFSYRDG